MTSIGDARRFTDGRQIVARYGIAPRGIVYRNPDVDVLYQAAVQREQGRVMANGALLQDTTPNVGRAAKNSFYVDDKDARFDGRRLDDILSWGNAEKGAWNNLPIAPKTFQRLKARVIEHLSGSGDLYVTDALSGRTAASRLALRVITDRAPSALFSRQIFLRPTDDELVGFSPEWVILHAPDVDAEPGDNTNGKPFIITDLAAGLTIIGGTRYHGQIKKAIFSVQNFRLPLRGILTMHAGASEGEGGKTAIHAGLSGTGKTTLSNTGHPVADDQIVIEIDAADPEAVVSNMEGGQYAKTENLRRDKEPETFDAIKYGTTAENIAIDGEGHADYADTRITANGRVGYPLEYVTTAKVSGMARAPENITFLTADGFGVLPPLARLTIDGGKFHFVCGFTSKMPGTELGVTEPVPTFSGFFGKPFMPLKASYYTDLLAKLVDRHGTRIWLVNTGWLGPSQPGRERVDILVSKAIINAVRDDRIDLSDDNFWFDPVFKHHVPKAVPGVDAALLDPRNFWSDKAAYAAAADKLAGIFQNQIARLDVPKAVAAAGPAPAGR
ncbi:MAG: phosphoenolpyruvate carboxykinase (ATP) [bacterium]